MSNALTFVNGNNEEPVDFVAQRVTVWAQIRRSPSYFGNFGNFIQFIMRHVVAGAATPSFGRQRKFPLITAFMAIV